MFYKVEIHECMLLEKGGRKRWTEGKIRRKKKGKKHFIIKGKIVYLEGMMVFKN